MLPVPFSHRLSLADVLPSSFASLRGESNALALPGAATVIVLVVDGLGAHMLKARAGYARTLSGASAQRIHSGFPTTTAAALTTLTTGVLPGVHGLVGYTVRHPDTGEIVNQLNGWNGALDPASWQRSPTQFELARDRGIPSFSVGAARYEDSGFTQAVLRGAEYAVASSIEDRLQLARTHLAQAQAGLAYVYVPELDQAAHREGWESDAWVHELEQLDSAVRSFTRYSPKGEAILVTSDHGMVDISPRNHRLLDGGNGLFDGIDAVAGEPRCLQLHFAPNLSHSSRASIATRWRDAEGDRAWVATRSEAVASGWFGPTVDEAVLPRLGDLFIAARKSVAYYDVRTGSNVGQSMVGQHGSLTSEETVVPLLRLGAYA